MIFGYAPTMLVERGWTLAAATSASSIVLWLVALSVPAGGLLADRSGRGDAVMLFGFVAFSVMLVAAARSNSVLAMFVLLGLVSGLPAGPIMSLPARVLKVEQRSVGMGLYYTLQYVAVVIAPWAAGVLASRYGGARIAFDFGAAMLVGCIVALGVFHRVVNTEAQRDVQR